MDENNMKAIYDIFYMLTFTHEQIEALLQEVANGYILSREDGEELIKNITLNAVKSHLENKDIHREAKDIIDEHGLVTGSLFEKQINLLYERIDAVLKINEDNVYSKEVIDMMLEEKEDINHIHYFDEIYNSNNLSLDTVLENIIESVDEYKLDAPQRQGLEGQILTLIRDDKGVLSPMWIDNSMSEEQQYDFNRILEHLDQVHAPANAQKNVQSNWLETNPNSDAYIVNKPQNLASMNYVDEQIANAKLSNTDIDLSNYATKNDLQNAIEEANDDMLGLLLGDDSLVDSLNSISEVIEYIDEHKNDARDHLISINDNLSKKVDKENGKSLISDSEIKRLATIENYVLPTATKSVLGGIKAGENVQISDTGVLDAIGYDFQIEMIDGSEPSVEVKGQFPNMIVVLKIPRGSIVEPEKPTPDPEPETGIPRMWYGFIPFDETGAAGYCDYDHINENMPKSIIDIGINNSTMVEADPAELGLVNINNVELAGYVCVILPANSSLIAMMDDGLGGQCTFTEFDTVSGLAIDNVVMVNKIDGIEYRLYGMCDTSGGGTYTIYIINE